jgi:hypothetical protein
LGRNKTDGIDASRIREYCELFKPSPWAPPSEAHRRLGELQTIRAGIIAGLTEWKNRKNSGIVDTEAQALADATILHFTSQLGAVEVTRLKSRGRLKPKQIVVAAMRKLLVLCFGVLKTGKPFDPAIAIGC